MDAMDVDPVSDEPAQAATSPSARSAAVPLPPAPPRPACSSASPSPQWDQPASGETAQPALQLLSTSRGLPDAPAEAMQLESGSASQGGANEVKALEGIEKVKLEAGQAQAASEDTTAALPRIPPDITNAVSPASPCADAAPPPPHASPVPRAWLPGDDAVLARATWERRAIVPLGVLKDEGDGAEAGIVWSEIARKVGDGRTASEVRERWDALSEEGAYARSAWTESDDARLIASLKEHLAVDALTFKQVRSSMGTPSGSPAGVKAWTTLAARYERRRLAEAGAGRRAHPRTHLACFARCGRLHENYLAAQPHAGDGPAAPHWSATEVQSLTDTAVALGAVPGSNNGGWDEGVEVVAMWTLLRAAVGGGKRTMTEVVQRWREGDVKVSKDAAVSTSQSASASAAVSFSWTADDDEQLLRLREEEHLSMSDIAARLGRLSTVVGRRYKKLKQLEQQVAPPAATPVHAAPPPEHNAPPKRLRQLPARFTPDFEPSVGETSKATAQAAGSSHKAWSADEDARLIQLRKDGVSVPGHIVILRAKGEMADPPKLPDWSAEDDQRLVDLCGQTAATQIAARLGRPYPAVLKRINELKVSGRITDPPPPAVAVASTLATSSSASSVRNTQTALPRAPVSGPPPTTASTNPLDTSTQNAEPTQIATDVGNCNSDAANAPPAPPAARSARLRYSANDDARIRLFRQAGLTWQQIDQQLGPSVTSVSTKPQPPPPAVPPVPSFVSSAHPLASTPLPPYTDADDRIICALKSQGVGLEEIGKALGRSGKSVARRVQKMRSEWMQKGLLSNSTNGPAEPATAPIAPPSLPTSLPPLPPVFPFLTSPAYTSASPVPPTRPQMQDELAQDSLAQDSLDASISSLFAIDPMLLKLDDSPAMSGLTPVQTSTTTSHAVERERVSLVRAREEDDDTPPAHAHAHGQVAQKRPRLGLKPVKNVRRVGFTSAAPWRRLELGMRGLRRFRELCGKGDAR
ncbi:hypothetical protein Rhopal_007093-T1 [Rhodotorula paludigena]|uniref:Myb-like domain-containing protein n=1 Tax=Rhodotorula paludigena TaxID=86838 RepID=A0AAV5GVQ3_9BASI|nr:hypothetical protein Rhopal_007093-T1 [Rhodotorula paludigena]